MIFKKGEKVKKIKGKHYWLDCFSIGEILIIDSSYDGCSYICIGKSNHGSKINQIVHIDCLQSVYDISYLNI